MSAPFFAALLLVLALGRPSLADDRTIPPDAARGDIAANFFARHCIECHGERVAKGDLRLDLLSRDFSDPAVVEIWSNVWQRLHDGEMPPKEKPRPDAAETTSLLRWVAEQTRASERPSGLRRLNRVEFENTLRDLLELPALDVGEMLPPDGMSQGFDKVADALGISHVQISGYLDAVDKALDQATEIALQPVQPEVTKERFYPQYEGFFGNRLHDGAVIALAADGPDLSIYDPATGRSKLEKHEDYLKLPPVKACGTFFHYDGAGRLILGQGGHIPQSGLHRVRISTYSFDWDHGKLLPAKETRPFRLGTKSRLLGYFDAPPNDATVSTFDTWLEPNDDFHFNPVSLCHGAGLEQGANSWAGPGVAVEYLEVEGPIYRQWPPPVRGLLFGSLELKPWQRDSNTTEPPRKHRALAHSPARPAIHTVVSSTPLEDSQALLLRFMERAYRRAVTVEETYPFVDLVRQALDRRATLEEALRGAYKAVLCSPSFLFLLDEPEGGGNDALAARLSYFL
ncbi:MAG TPA: DUF1587 domain-containing protein, partial [Pirellulales bacterium]|nr:DUF1587 domain-containing protein [Pirellulales bacterium]